MRIFMQYTIDGALGKYMERDRYRLQQNNSWRRLNEFEIRDGDYITSDPFAVSRFYLEGVVNIAGETYRANPSVLTLSDETIAFISPKFHRIEKPRKFDMEEMRNVIALGDDSMLNALVLDVHGKFSLSDLSLAMKNPNVAVRNEAFGPGNGYVGIDASNDRVHIRDTYMGMLEGWKKHLETGELDVFVDFYSQSSENEMWAEIDSMFG